MKQGLWEYIWGITFKELISEVKWAEIFVYAMIIFFSIGILHWIGVIVAPILIFLMGRLEGGAVGELTDYPEKEYVNKYTAGIKDCKYCSRSPYDHKWNVYYQDSLKWYERLFY